MEVGWVVGGGGGGPFVSHFLWTSEISDLKGNYQKSKCLESKRVRYSQNFNYKTFRNLIISPFIVITIATFSAYLLQLITNNDSLIHQKFVILKFCHRYQETPHLVFTCSKSTIETPKQCVEYVQR